MIRSADGVSVSVTVDDGLVGGNPGGNVPPLLRRHVPPLADLVQLQADEDRPQQDERVPKPVVPHFDLSTLDKWVIRFHTGRITQHTERDGNYQAATE